MEISWEKSNAIDEATHDIKALMTVWANLGGAGSDKHLDGYLWGALHDHVADLIMAVHGVRWKGGEEFPEDDATPAPEASSSTAGEAPKPPAAEKPGGCYDEIQRRMDVLEDSHKNAPVITAGRLEDWQNRTRIVSRVVYGARETVELLNSEERDATAFLGPLSLVQDALDKAEDELSALCGVIGAAKVPEPQEGDAEAAE